MGLKVRLSCIYCIIYTLLECSWQGCLGNIIVVCFGENERNISTLEIFRKHLKSDLINSAEGHHKNGYKEVRQCWKEWKHPYEECKLLGIREMILQLGDRWQAGRENCHTQKKCVSKSSKTGHVFHKSSLLWNNWKLPRLSMR